MVGDGFGIDTARIGLHDRCDLLPQPYVRIADADAGAHAGQGPKRVLDLHRMDVLAAADDDVLEAPEDGQVAGLVDTDMVAGQEVSLRRKRRCVAPEIA